MTSVICTGLRKIPGRCPFWELRHVSHVRSKAASKRERPWYRPCSTYLTEYRILMRHDAASPGFRRASGRKPSTDNEGMAEHMRVRPGDPDPRGIGELMQAAGGGVPVHPGAAAVEQDRPARAGSSRSRACPATPTTSTGTISSSPWQHPGCKYHRGHLGLREPAQLPTPAHPCSKPGKSPVAPDNSPRRPAAPPRPVTGQALFPATRRQLLLRGVYSASPVLLRGSATVLSRKLLPTARSSTGPRRQ